MENKKAISYRIFLLVMLGLSLAFCNKDDDPRVNGNEPVKDYHQSAATQFITAGGTNYAYRTLGNKAGVPLFMISALGNSMDDWDPALTNGLAKQRKVIIFDIQGVSSSGGTTPENISDMAKGVVTFIKALGFNKVDLMGFSMGSFISQQIVLTEPVLVNKVILTGTGPKGAEGLGNLPGLLQKFGGLNQEDFLLKFAFTSSEASITAGKQSYERIQKRVENRDAAATPESLTAQIKAVLGWAQPSPNALNELKTITQPVLIVQGENDLPVPVVNAINMSNNFPNAQLIVYPDAGHAAVFQSPDKFVASALGFLSK
jgi:pimeloyl-ACP methyl ester carboxylesterase